MTETECDYYIVLLKKKVEEKEGVRQKDKLLKELYIQGFKTL